MRHTKKVDTRAEPEGLCRTLEPNLNPSSFRMIIQANDKGLLFCNYSVPVLKKNEKKNTLKPIPKHYKTIPNDLSCIMLFIFFEIRKILCYMYLLIVCSLSIISRYRYLTCIYMMFLYIYEVFYMLHFDVVSSIRRFRRFFSSTSRVDRSELRSNICNPWGSCATSVPKTTDIDKRNMDRT